MSVNPTPPAPEIPASASPWSVPPARPDRMASVERDLAAARERIAAAHREAREEVRKVAVGKPPATQMETAEVLVQYQNPVTGKWWDVSYVRQIRLPAEATVTAREARLNWATERLMEPLRAAGAQGSAIAVVLRPGRSSLVGHAQANPQPDPQASP